MRTVVMLWVLLLLAMNPVQPAKADAPVIKHPLALTHAITIDATALKPPKAWSIPGVTEPLQSLTGPLTNQVMTVNLRPGRYMFTTTSLSFEFTFDLEGKLDYAKMHDQCVSGRGTSELFVNCRFLMPQ
jgi:anti-sigma factor ChrR (cupin superfamily)